MTITKYTFFSPNGNDYPITSDADAKLYQMLSGYDYTTFGRKDWKNTTEAGLTKTFVNTSIVMAGRYFELRNHLINLNASSINYVHININLTNTTNPVSVTVENKDNSNEIDINNGSGVYKRAIEFIETNTGSIVKTTPLISTRVFNDITVEKAHISSSNVTNLDVSDNVTFANGFRVKNKGWIDDLQVYSSFISKTVATTETLTVGTTLTANNAISKNNTTTGTLTVKGNAGKRSNQYQTPTVYSTINGTALEEFVLYRNGNVITGNFAEIIVAGGIGGNGAIIGWIQDNAFKPEYTQKFSMRTRNGRNFMLSVDAGGAFRNWGDSISAGDEIYGGVFWICKGTEGGLRSK